MKRGTYIRLIVGMLLLVCGVSTQAANSAFYIAVIQQDTAKKDTLKPYTPTKRTTYEPTFRFGDPFSNPMSPSPLLLSDPSSVDLQVEYDSSINYSVYERIGDVNFRPVTTMTFEEYDSFNDREIAKSYFKERSSGLDGESAVSGRSLIPRLYVSPMLDRLFGGSYVDIKPTGFVNVDFGGRYQRVDNPSVPIRQQRNGGFNFDQQISLNLVGKVGEKLAVTANFDNKNTFDFQNNLKVEYTGFAEDIVKKIEIGNVSMPVSNSLMTGAQSLFGIKTQLQFGKLFVTSVLSRQQGQSDVLTIESGFQGREFEVRGSNYDDNRHFFLGHFFRDNYERWLSNLPQITSGVNVTRVEVYVINRNNDTRTTREVLALQDLGEGQRIYQQANDRVLPGKGNVPTDNAANELYRNVANITRKSDEVSGVLERDFGFTNSTDFVKVGTARRLDENEYVINNKLGYITLLRKLANDEMLAVSYQYTYAGQIYKVGELTEDYSGLSDDQVIILKMLRPNKVNTRVPTWDLMMKNIYNLGASQVEQSGFTLRVHYRDDASGIDNPSLHEGRLTKDRPLVELLGLDQLNQNNDRQRDGNFDYIPGVTIDERNGNIIFPVLEPFGATLRSYFDANEVSLREKYVYDTLYRTTKADAELLATKNKFFIQGRFNAGSSSEIALPGINIAPNSVIVMAGNTLLTEGLDYSVDYNLGRVRILNNGILSSGKTLTVSYEKADLFNFQSRWLYGTRLDYQFSEKFNVGATFLHLNERPGGVSRFTIGEEPTRNSKYGLDINYQNEVPFLTKMMDWLPLVSTKAPSSITFNAEFAQMVPGTSNLVDGEGTSYIDDFEQAVTPIGLNGWQAWHLGATPSTENNRFGTGEQLSANFKRARLAWYTVDQSVFYRTGGGNRPDNITNEDLENHYIRPILPQEIFRQRQRNLVVTPEPILDIAYFPSERGPYNYSTDLTAEGLLRNPASNYGAITRAITNEVDFDKSNIEYLEFWIMDPFIGYDDQNPRGRVLDGIFNVNNSTGGELIFNLGSVSEDVLPDGRHAFESGLPANGDPSATLSNQWGRQPAEPFLTNNFDRTSNQSVLNQDVGLDGLNDEVERDPEFFGSYLTQLQSVLSPTAFQQFAEDPSADNFRYFLGNDLDSRDLKILERYKYFNGLDGNSPPTAGNNVPSASSVLPNNEDLNSDNTISNLEEYYEYRIPLQPGQLDIGRGYIIDKISNSNGEATWYLFRIPIRDIQRPFGGIDGFKTMRYIRMYLTGFEQPVVLRMAKLQLVGSQWRKYQEALTEPGLNEIPESSTSDFSVSVVNLEENSTGSDNKSPYVLPPGINRDRDNTTIINREQNEQSLQVCVEDLADQDSRAVYKNVTLDLINYGRLKMFFHAEANGTDMLNDDEVTAFLRFGTDFTEHYYEIEVPLKITPLGITPGDTEDIRREIWPLENEIDLSVDELLGIKAERNRANLDELLPYSTPSNDGRYKLTVKGRPDMSSIQVMMIGVRNPRSDDRAPKSVCIWANELRVTDFDRKKGWAANARLSTKLADVATISVSTRYTSIGFGGIQQTIQQRTRQETLQYDVSANINVDKFLLPERTGLRVPMFVSYEKITSTPQFDPLDPDVPLDASLATFDSDAERERYRRIVEERSARRSINFTNVRKEKVNPDAKRHIWDVENLAFSYAYSDVVTSNVTTETYLQKSVGGGVTYNYSPKEIIIQPFAKSEGLKSPYLKLIKDINVSLLPNSLSFRSDLNRSFRLTQLYNNQLTTDDIDPYFERLFTFNRDYAFRWALFKSLNIDYSARVNAVIDEPDSLIQGDITTVAERQFIMDQITSLGRMKNFQQDVNMTYRTPLDKLPLTDWLSADLKFAIGYNWIAGSLDQNDAEGQFFGHTIQNRRDQGLMGKVDMVKLYNKVTFLKAANAPPKRSANTNDEPAPSRAGQILLRTLMSVRNVNFSYNIRESTVLSGFTPTARLLGMDSTWAAPGWDFIMGSQDPEIRREAARQGWITRSRELTAPFEQTYSNDLTLRASVEPSADFKIQLDASRTNTASFQEIFRYDGDTLGYQSLTPSRNGSYKISMMTIGTSFDKQGPNNTSPAFEQFVQNIQTIRTRQNQLNANDGEYDILSQDVLIPAFIAAYSGQEANQVALSPFPKIPLPGWRVDYNGLSKVPALAELLSAVTLSHGYRSMYNVSSYNNSLQYSEGMELRYNVLDYPQATLRNDSNRFIPVYVVNQVMISEQYAPLIGLNVRAKNNMSTRMEYKKERSLSLNLANAQITETNNNDVTFEFGYTKDKFKLPFKIQGRTIALNNEVTMRMSFTYRDAETMQRRIEGENKITNGNTNVQIRPSISYKLNTTLDLTMYFDRSVTEPKVSSFKTATTTFGFRLRYGLAQR